MPKKTGTENPFGYDQETDTVQVGRHDLERRLLLFRSLVRKEEPGSWDHMRDYDLSFERLADAVDAAAQARQGSRWEGPDLRLRCTTTEAVYDWPDGAPTVGFPPVLVCAVRFSSGHVLRDDASSLVGPQLTSPEPDGSETSTAAGPRTRSATRRHRWRATAQRLRRWVSPR